MGKVLYFESVSQNAPDNFLLSSSYRAVTVDFLQQRLGACLYYVHRILEVMDKVRCPYVFYSH